ncbi:unnamed protein product [Linum trigynum]|uniref:CRIB domain-containing protein n=1 Tax=Linum trigynum TaxID=586398 RepID=A0AAV2EC87_9ROSI
MSIPHNKNKDPKSMKGLLKGLRYISQIFDEEKEAEMQIGNPTDVKHVAHIGWDGNNDSPPTWMTEFKGQSGSSSPNGNRDLNNSSSSLQSIPEEHKSATTSPRRNGTVPPSEQQTKSSRRRSSGNGEVENKQHKQTRKASRNTNREVQNQADGASKSTSRSSSKDGDVNKVEDAHKKSGRRKKSKELVGASSKSKSKATTSGIGDGHNVVDGFKSEVLSEKQSHISNSIV